MMTKHHLAAALAAALVAGPLAACSSGAASGVASQATSAAGALGSKAASAASSALGSLKAGVDATADVTVGKPVTASDGRTTAELTVDNSTSDQHSYTISVSFKSEDGSPLDVVVVNVSDVPAHGTGHATARSTHHLNGATSAEVIAALRY
jgi:hypothetical protein